MNRFDLEKFSKEELINLLLKIASNKQSPTPAPRTKKQIPIPAPRRSVKELVNDYEQNIILPPMEFRDKPIPAPIEFRDDPIPAPKIKISKRKTAIKDNALSFEISIENNEDPLKQLQNTRKAVERHLIHLLASMKGIKLIECVKATYTKMSNGEMEYKTAYFFSSPYVILNNSDIEKSLQSSKNHILEQMARLVSEGSGWTIDSIDNHYINIVKYQPVGGSSYIPLPKELQNGKKGLINMKNYDNQCFRWCHIRHLNPQEKYPQRIKKVDKAYVENLDYSGIEFPVEVKQYNKIEKQNSIRINVFSYENKKPFPVYVSKEKYENTMNLLLIADDEKTHYVLIKDFNRFMYNQTKHKSKKHFCMFCLQHFTSEEILNKHKENCIAINGTQAIKMPDKSNNILKFNNFHKQLPVPFVIYADFEALTEKVSGCQPSTEKSFTQAYQKHTDCGYGYKVVCCYDDKYTKPINIYRGPKAVYKFMDAMLKEIDYCKYVMKKYFKKPLKMTISDEEQFQKESACHICGKEYKNNDIKVRDHCHITGVSRGSAHQDCNLNFQPTNKIPVIFHNLRGYDSHFIMQEIGKIVKDNKYINKKGEECEMFINAIPNNMERYMAFMLGNHLTFIDSFQFMSSSLDKLVSNLPKDFFKYTSEQFKYNRFNLMIRKGVYPYDFMDSFNKFYEKLPSKEEFYSQLNDQHISEEDYQHAKTVWEVFNLKNMGQYHDLYLKSDILLLADVFENFRKTCLRYYKLDPCHYFTAPGLSWDAMLKMTDIKLELMTDIDMFQFIEKGMRGGVSYIAHRYGKANNKYMSDYNPKHPSKHIIYLDANNLYGYAMSQYLPTGNFKWLSQKKIDGLNLDKYEKESKKGLILEVDLEYPEQLHDLHNSYPLAPEQIKVQKNMLSNYCKQIAEKYNISTGLATKLIPTLNKKERYVLHYRNLQLYIDLGLKMSKIHRALEFDQSPWLKKYIDYNTNKRKYAKNAFEKDFFKLLNNAVFGKTMENLRKRVDVKLVTNEKQLNSLTSKPTYVSSKIFNENLVAVHKIKEQLTLNRPAYIGMCILDLSKTLMYDFHYNYIKKRYGSKAQLLFTDTDSLCYEIETDDIYEDLWQDKHLFDNSDYPKDSPFFDLLNKKVIGKFKDEAASIPITEFVGLRSKMYSYIKENKNGNKTAKGIKKYIINNELKHINYKDTLLENKQLYHQMKTIRSYNHQLASYELNKVSLSCYDDKRYIHANGISSYAYGHKSITP